jgi:hypothetical protein
MCENRKACFTVITELGAIEKIFSYCFENFKKAGFEGRYYFPQAFRKHTHHVPIQFI